MGGVGMAKSCVTRWFNDVFYHLNPKSAFEKKKNTIPQRRVETLDFGDLQRNSKIFGIINLFQNLKNFVKENVRIASHPSRFTSKIPAFTLAEILVTMGVIGIVAALTLPMLTRNYQFYIRQQQFKKAYAALSIAVQKTQIDMGEGVRCTYLNGTWLTDYMVDCNWFYNELMNNLKVLKVCENNALEKGCIPPEMKTFEELYMDVYGEELSSATRNGCSGFLKANMHKRVPVYIFNSGFSIILYYSSSSGGPQSQLFLLDVNAQKGPNKWGHDIFAFKFNKKSSLDSVFQLVPLEGCFAPQKGGYYTTTFMKYLYGQNAEL